MTSAVSRDVIHRNNVHLLGQESQPIVFAHGFGSDQSAWRHQAAAFASTYRIVLFDHVGAGQSDRAAYSPLRHSTLYGYAEDLLELCAALQLSQVILVGHSVGGIVSLLAALIAPDCFKQLIFIGASPRYLNDAAVGYDIAVPLEVGQYMADYLPQSRLIHINAKGHLLHLSAAPNEVTHNTLAQCFAA